MRALITCVLVVVVGCAAEEPPVARPRSPYGCAGPTAVAVTPAQPPSGRVEVKVLGESPDGTRLSVLAEGASASQLAVRIGEALHAVTRVDPELELVPVSVYFPDITIDVLGAMLRASKVRVLRPEWNKDR